MKNLLKGIGAALGYLGLYLLVSVIVMLVAVIAYVFTLGFTGGIAAYAALEETIISFIFDKALLLTLITCIITLIFYLIIQAIFKKPLKSTIYLNSVSLKDWWPVPLLGITMNVFVSFLVTALPIPENILESYSEAVGYADDISLMLIISVVLVAPIFEEILFRGLITQSLSRGIPFAALVIGLQAILFGLLHGHIISIIYATFLGIILGIVRTRYNSLYPSIILHMLFNAANYILLPLYYVLPETDLTYIILVVVSLVLSVLLFSLILKKTKNFKTLDIMNGTEAFEHNEDLDEQDIVTTE